MRKIEKELEKFEKEGTNDIMNKKLDKESVIDLLKNLYGDVKMNAETEKKIDEWLNNIENKELKEYEIEHEGKIKKIRARNKQEAVEKALGFKPKELKFQENSKFD